MIKNSVLAICIITIFACFIKIHYLNNIVKARVVPTKQSTISYNSICARVVDKELLNEFISYHSSQGFLTFTFYSNEKHDDIEYIFGDIGLEITFKHVVDNIEWDCLLDSAFNPTISNVVIMNTNEFIFPLKSKYDTAYGVDVCTTLEEFTFIDNGDENLITQNIKREMYTSFKNKKAIIPIGKTSEERVRLLRNYSSQTLYNGCTVSKRHGIAKFNKEHTKQFVIDKRLRDLHYKVTLGRR